MEEKKESKKNKIVEAIKNMVNELIENKKKEYSGFPIVSASLDKDFELIDINVNSRADDKKTDIENHAEYKCYSELENKDDQIICLITIPPCNPCFNAIFKNKNKYEIYYFIDKHWNKNNRKYSKDVKKQNKVNNTSNKIKKIPYKFSIITKFNINYIIMSYLGGLLTQKDTAQFVRKKILKITKEKLQILKNLINNNQHLKEEIEIPEVLSMIEKAEKMNIKDVSFKDYDSVEKFEWII